MPSSHNTPVWEHLITLLSNSGFANIQQSAPWLEPPALIHPYQSSRILILCFGFNVILVESSCAPGTPANQLTLSSFVFQDRHYASEMVIVQQAESQFICFADRGLYDTKSKDSSSCGCRCFPSFYPANCRRESVKRWSFDLEKQGLTSAVSVLGIRSATESWPWWLQFSHKLTPWFKIGYLEEV